LARHSVIYEKSFSFFGHAVSSQSLKTASTKGPTPFPFVCIFSHIFPPSTSRGDRVQLNYSHVFRRLLPQEVANKTLLGLKPSYFNSNNASQILNNGLGRFCPIFAHANSVSVRKNTPKLKSQILAFFGHRNHFSTPSTSGGDREQPKTYYNNGSTMV
jgi:hypothetical protein